MTVCPVLDNLGIDYWCDFGTLLGEAHSKHKAHLQNIRTTYQQLHAVYLLQPAEGWKARSACPQSGLHTVDAGAYREKDIILHDNDADVVLLNPEWDQLEAQLKQSLPGWKVRRCMHPAAHSCCATALSSPHLTSPVALANALQLYLQRQVHRHAGWSPLDN
jgi:hypothetical protein